VRSTSDGNHCRVFRPRVVDRVGRGDLDLGGAVVVDAGRLLAGERLDGGHDLVGDLAPRPAERHAIGTIGFHGPPDDQGRVEVGYRVEAPYRRQGFARESVQALFDWAASAHGIHRFVASVSPANEPSLQLIAGFGFRRTGEHMDEIDGLEYEFETDWPPTG